jgi:hypothetical protein
VGGSGGGRALRHPGFPLLGGRAREHELRPGFFLPLGTARYTAVTAVTAGYGNGTQR